MSLSDKLSKQGLIPQFELGPRLGGIKWLFMRSGVIMRPITMASAMVAAWSTTDSIRNLFVSLYQFTLFGFDLFQWIPGGAFTLYLISAGLAICAWMTFDYVVLLSSEQTFMQEQAHRAERSPLKRDTEKILDQIEQRTDGGTEQVEDDGTATTKALIPCSLFNR